MLFYMDGKRFSTYLPSFGRAPELNHLVVEPTVLNVLDWLQAYMA